MNHDARQPKALSFLFLTELWERFGFYITQGMLVLFMAQYFGFPDNTCYTISGIFAGLVYISPFAGGYLADQYLGFKRAIIWGGLFLVLGYTLMALANSISVFYYALATIIIGNGLLKPNISSLLGVQYKTDDPKRESGFTFFYTGINIGAALSGVSGYIRHDFGWHVTFALASVGMLIGLITFLVGLKVMKDNTPKNKITKPHAFIIFIICLLTLIAVSFLLRIHALADLLLPIAGIGLLIFLLMLSMKQTKADRKRMLMLNMLILSSIVFWTLFLQLFNSANLYVERLVDKNIFGLELTTTVFYASEGIFIIILGPLFAAFWEFLARHRKNPLPISKFVLGLLFAGLSFSVLGFSTFFPNAEGLIPGLWVFVAYLLLTIGELLLSPIGLSAVTILAPPHLTGMMMGIWFVAIGFGGIFAGWLAKLSSVPDVTATVAEKLIIYQHAFFDYAYLAFFVTVILFFVRLSLKKRFNFDV